MSPLDPDQEQHLSEASERAREAGADAPEAADVTAEESDVESSAEEADAESVSDADHGTLKPQPRPSLDRRLDSDPEGSHVCAPTDA